ncbi:MAG: hypothetical protein IJW81_06830, partial [Clostridia bacterium]|nr:hypothetical protein [Clostridia bacterium]
METPESLVESFGYYLESKKIEIASVSEGAGFYDLTLKIADDKIKSVDLLINGKLVRSEAVSDGTVLRIEASELREAGKYNSIEVLAKKEDGSYIINKRRQGQNGTSAMEADYVYIINK